jgi:uncharacterized membrane protein
LFLSFLPIIGRLHPVLVHLPIGILLAGILLQWLYNKGSYQVSLSVIKIIFLVGAVCAWLSCITGYTLSLSSDYDTSLVFWHKWLGICLAITASVIYIKIQLQQTDHLYLTLSIGLLVLIFATGHLGGSLTHGEDYISSALMQDADPVYPPAPAITNVQEANLYADIIRPLLRKECYECHSVSRQKGKLRLDDTTHIMAGGKSGPVIFPGRPSESELVKRLLLPTTDEHHMPKEKPSLKEVQIAVITWWIANGGDFNKKVKAIQQPPPIRTSLLALQNDNGNDEANALVPSAEVQAASAKSINDLKEKGVSVIPVARNSHYLQAGFINVSSPVAEVLPLLLPIQSQLIFLKIGNTALNDSSIRVIAKCRALTSLQLNNTGVSDKNISALQSLHELQSLNLVATAVTVQGIISLKQLKNLRRIYLYQTEIKETDTSLLKKFFPKTSIVLGGYNVPSISSDTVILKAPRGE